jgi:hypothetical protein
MYCQSDLLFEDSLQVYEAWRVGSRVEVAAPRALAPSIWIAVAWIAAAGGAFAIEDEVDSAKVGCGFRRERGEWSSARAMKRPPVFVWLGGWSRERPAVGPIGRAHTRGERLPR